MKTISFIFLLLFASLKVWSQTCGVRTLNVSVSAQTTNSITINWSSAPGVQYNILMTEDDVNFLFVATLAPVASSYTINNLVPGHSYSFVVSSADCYCVFHGIDNLEDIIGTSPAVSLAPDAPVSITSTGGTPNTLNLVWSSSYGATGYKLDASTDPAFSNLVNGYNNLNVSGTSQTVSGLTAGTNYYFRVRAVNSGGASPYANGSSVTTALPPVATNASAITGTGFIANWNVAATATGYLLDVATDNSFTNILAAYSNLAVVGNSKTIAGLTNGTTYYYRVRSVNASGNSANSNIITVTTIPGIPGLVSFSAVTATGFQASWNAVPGATSYQVDVSGNAAFSNFATGFNAASVSGTSVTTTGLFAGLVYYVRIRAVNANGVSGNSATCQQLLIPPAPFARAATSPTTTSFTANWIAALGATAYSIDVADNSGFNPTLPAYGGLVTTSTALTVNGLTPGTTYYYRIKASNSSGTSEWSTNTSALTLPQPPLAIDATATATGMNVNWVSVASATAYELFISTDQNFTNLIPVYGPKTISGNSTTTETVSGLTPSTLYYLKMRAANSSGTSDFSIIRIVSTTAAGGPTSIGLELSLLPQYQTVGDPQNQLQIKASGGTGTLAVKLYHRKNSESNYTVETVQSQGSSFIIGMAQEWADEFGMQYYFEVTDQAGQVKRSAEPASPHQMPVKIKALVLPIDRFGKEIQNYQIISIPYQLSANRISDLLEPIKGLGAYNKKNWRLVHYEDGVNVDYLDGLSVSSFLPGKAYWFISRNPIELNLGSAIAPDFSTSKPFTMSLKKGWNQIGNPFPFDINWTDVLAANGSPQTVSNLQIFNSSTLSFEDSDLLKKFNGGFVYLNADLTITFPVSLTRKGGRTRQTNAFEAGAGEWHLPISLQQGNSKSGQAGIGMHHAAQEGWDRFDRMSPPAIFQVTGMVTRSGDLELNQNVVPPATNYTWNFTAKSDEVDAINLSWPVEVVGQLKGQLTLYDQDHHVLVDMSHTSSYQVQPGTSLTIMYSEKQVFPTDPVQVGTAYPNPFTQQVSISFIHEVSDPGNTTALLVISDLNGKKVYESQLSTDKAGITCLTWNGKNNAGAELNGGWYLYQLYIQSSSRRVIIHGKIAKQ